VTGQVPLTPIQHWFFDQRFAHQHHFNQAVLLELREALNPAVLEKAVQHLLTHHDALRLRFMQTDSGWEQTNAASEESPVFSIIDLSTFAEEDRPSVLEETATKLHASLSLADGPLVRMALFDFGPNEPGRLLVVIHHLAVDGVSWRILLDDLQITYQQLSADKVVTLPPKTTSFKEWSERLEEYSQSPAVEQEQSYWLSLPWHSVAPLSVDYEGGENSVASEGTVYVSLNKGETQALLHEVPATLHTQINEVLLTALTGAFAKRHSARYLPIDLEGHGREEVLRKVDLTRTVGWFTSVFPVLLELEGNDKTGALLSIKEQLRRIPQRGIGYGLLRYVTKASDIADKLKALPQSELSFNYLGQIDHLPGSSPLFVLAKESCGVARSPRARRSYLLEINGMVKDGQLQFGWTYSHNIHKEATIEVLAAKFIKRLQSLISQSQTVTAEILIPSDFPLAEINQQQLSKVITKLRKASH
jgi:non-ribosomal peptide synthase protein (TIGR01720 family)